MRLFLTYHHAPDVPLRMIAGLTLVKRAILEAQRAGFREVHVRVSDDSVTRVRQELSDSRIELVWDVSSFVEALAVDDASGECAVAFGDRVWSAAFWQAIASPLGEGQTARTIETPHECDVGLFRVRGTPSLDWHTPAELAQSLASPERSAVDAQWQEIRSPSDVLAAEKMLIGSLAKPTDGTVSRLINRKISNRVTRLLAGSRVRPNHVTAVVFLLGLGSGPLAYQGTYSGFLIGGLLYYLSAVLDGVDGELSRLKFEGSSLGMWLDTIVDDVVVLTWMSGTFLGLGRSGDAELWTWVGGSAVSAYLAVLLVRYYLMVFVVQTGDHQKLDPPVRFAPETGAKRLFVVCKQTIARSDFLPFAAMVTAVFGLIWLFAIGFAIGAMVGIPDALATAVRVSRGDGAAPIPKDTDNANET